ncbi:hypothetical protein GCM10027275_48960 [Rhabdobacter roseus]|uniref:CubicO group peptidase (Beta-lactamase class C family) n=1 Tax=Rhabdobacter roseus TaxID=1655419 RepID=A0A840U4E1_9BACT|nr:serine hydrolase domain-containing protein [Rhabdobacter roseus]MBB5286960.1 CubicO group peptidase (beta-lactamase class C family) [Rhabdobacter roseus]
MLNSFLRSLVLLGLLTGLFIQCKKNLEPVTPATLRDSTQLSNVTDVAAIVTATLTEFTEGEILQFGFVWSDQHESPTVADQRLDMGRPKGDLPLPFNHLLVDLLPNTTYHVRIFVESPRGTFYGPVTTFRTQSTPSGVLTKLAQVLTDSLRGRDFGYSFAIYEKGTLVASSGGGFQSRAVEAAGAIPATIDSKMQIASMTKTITAMAFFRLAAQKNIKATDPILNYLPPTWPKGPNLNRITFRDLLTHRSGITGFADHCTNGSYVENVWSGLKSLTEKGIKESNHGNYCYQNVNFGLFRVLIPSLLGYTFTGQDDTDEAATQQMYLSYLQSTFFTKAGIPAQHLLTNSPQRPTLGYDYPYSGTFGFNPGSFEATVGAYGFYLSAQEAGRLYAQAFSTPDESLLTQAMKDSILTKGYGTYSTITPYGRFSYHDGWWYIRSGGVKAKGFRSLWMKCPNDVTVVLFTNALRDGDHLFPLRSERYLDIVSFVLWAYTEARAPARNGRSDAETNFHKYLEYPEPH